MTKEQKQEALAALDTYAAIFGPRLTSTVDFSDEGNGPLADGCCCAIGALGIYDAQIKPDVLIGGIVVFNWYATAVRFGFTSDVEVFVMNDSIRGTPEERFTRMRKWIEDYPTTD